MTEDAKTPAAVSGSDVLDEHADLPMVAVVGRPNVGKSTLVNRILGHREAIVEERPGVTRDRKEVLADWAGRYFRLVDTGGWLQAGSDLDKKVSAQSARAIAEADAILFVTDAQIGLTDEDEQAARLVRKAGQPVFLVGNKMDNPAGGSEAWDLLSLGLGDPWQISSLHGLGVADLLDAVIQTFAEQGEAEAAVARRRETGDHGPVNRIAREDREEFGVAIVGRPNVGKSTLFNRLIGDERSVVHDMAGTTRDTVDTLVDTTAGPIRFIDTAGMRRKSRIDEDTEFYSSIRALSAIDTADVAMLVIDGTEGVTHQDQRLAERIDAAGCPVLIVVNKWEMLDEEHRIQVMTDVEDRLAFLVDAPLFTVSALTGKNVQRLLPALDDTITVYTKRVPTRAVNQAIREAQAAHQAPTGGRVLYATQVATDPPTFTLFVNRTLPRTYLRYLERALREAFDLGGTPIKLRVKPRNN